MGPFDPAKRRPIEDRIVTPGTSPPFDHVVVLMFENRSFDNLLGSLYSPGQVPSFEGTMGRDLSNPVPPDLGIEGPATVSYHVAGRMDTPDPDPGEEYPHVNTQLFGTVAPESNRFRDVDEMSAPFNSPVDSLSVPRLNGFVADYANVFRVEMGRSPSYPELSQVMSGFTPDQVPVLSDLARGFAVFDHWFCEVPSQTYANRSFFHAASSSGFVDNGPFGKFATLNDAPTILERLESAGRTWRVYIDPEQILPATALIHARRLAPYFATHFHTIFDFYHDAQEGTLPDYAFLEPNMFHPHTDMHPPGAAKVRQALHLPAPQAILGGERLLAQVYEAVRTSSSPTGSNYANTLLLVTFDEHGGTFDHVPPPPAPPPGDSSRTEKGFRFDRSGVRVPTLAVSAWVDAGTVVTSEFRSTSVIRTLRERWNLGPPLTRRDAFAPDLSPLLTRSAPRNPDDWPLVPRPPEPLFAKILSEIDTPLSRLERDLIGEALAHEATVEGRPVAADARSIRRRDARGHLKRIQGKMFPAIAGGRTG